VSCCCQSNRNAHRKQRPAVIAVAYGAWTGGRVVTVSAIRMQRDAEGRLPA
jgi:hypothetical protein